MTDAAAFNPWLAVFMPTILWTVVAAAFLYAANRAIRDCPGEPAADRHFIASAAVISVLAALVLSWVVRAVRSGDGSLFFVPQAAWYVTVWATIVACGSAIFTMRLIAGSIHAEIICARGMHVVGGRLADVMDRAKRAMDVHGNVDLIVSPHCAAPFCLGVLRRRVVLPPSVVEMQEIEQRAILLHEIAHIKRGDALGQFLSQILGILLWWNPLYWLAVRWLESLREQACDEMVLGRMRDKHTYTRLLLSFVDLAPRLPLSLAFAKLGMASRRSMDDRLEALPAAARASRLYQFPGELTRWHVIAFLTLVVGILVILDGVVMHEMSEFIESIRILDDQGWADPL